MNKLSLVAITTALSLLMLSTNVFAMDKPPVFNIDLDKLKTNNVQIPPSFNLDFIFNSQLETPPNLELNFSKIKKPIISPPSFKFEAAEKRIPRNTAIKTTFIKIKR